MKFSIVLRYCGDFAAQLNFLVRNTAHLIKRLDIPGLAHVKRLICRPSGIFGFKVGRWLGYHYFHCAKGGQVL